MTTTQNTRSGARPMRMLAANAAATAILVVGMSLYGWKAGTNARKSEAEDTRLRDLGGRIALYDEVLTMSALAGVLSGDHAWEERYNGTAPELDAAIQGVRSQIRGAAATAAIEGTNVANLELVKLETLAFRLTREGRRDSGLAVLRGATYAGLKQQYAAGLNAVLRDIGEHVAAGGRRRTRGMLVAALLMVVVLTVVWLGSFRITRRFIAEQKHVQSVLQDRAHIASALRDSEERYRDLFDHSSDLIQSVGPDGRYVFTNPALRSALGYSEDELGRMTALDVVSPEHHQHYMTVFQSVMQGGSVEHVETEFVARDGRRVAVEGNVSCVLKDGKPFATRGYYRDVTERKRAEEKLEREAVERQHEAARARQAAKEWQETFDAITDIVAVISADHRILRVNRAGLAGRKSEELVGRKCHVAVHGLDTPLPGCPCVETLRTMRPAVGEFTQWGRHFAATADPILDDQGRLVAFVHAVKDITERKKAEQALRESEERLRTITDAAKDAIIMMDDSGLVTFWNPAAEAAFGYTASEALGRKLHEFLVPERFRAAHAAAFSHFRVTGKGGAVGKTVELAAIRKDGTEIPAELSLSAIKIGDKWHSVGIVRDITERKHAEAALRQEQHILALSQQIAHVGSWTVPLDTMLGQMSEEASRIFGVTPGSVTLTIEGFLELLHPEDRSAMGKWFQSCVTGQQPPELEFRAVRPDGTVRYLLGRGELRQGETGKAPRLVGSVQDITERRRAEAELAQKNSDLVQLNQLKNHFLGMAAHDLRNPLSVTLAASSFLLEEAGRALPEEKKTDFLARIRKSSEFMLKLIDDLLDVAKIESGRLDLRPAPHDLCSVIEENVTFNRMLAEKKGIRLAFAPECGLPPVILDRQKIEQVLNNLVSNALKFSLPGSMVRVSASRVNGSVVVTVADRGPGIPSEELDRLFKPFSRTSVRSTAGERSTGLGLAISRKIVEAHGGRIWAESEVGMGSTFSFSLPVSTQDA